MLCDEKLRIVRVSDSVVKIQATSWKLEEAIQLFYVGHEGLGPVAAGSAPIEPPREGFDALPEQTSMYVRFVCVCACVCFFFFLSSI